MICHISVACDAAAATKNVASPNCKRALAPEPVAERAGREQEAGEDERVRRHDPLELRLGCTEVAREGGERHVEARVAGEDDEEAEAEDAERPPAPLVGPSMVGRRRG